MNLCVYTCFVYLQPFCVTLDFKLFIDSIHILFLLYLLLWFWDFIIKNLQDFIKIYRALIKDIFLLALNRRRVILNRRRVTLDRRRVTLNRRRVTLNRRRLALNRRRLALNDGG